jgi:hypothetical protein
MSVIFSFVLSVSGRFIYFKDKITSPLYNSLDEQKNIVFEFANTNLELLKYAGVNVNCFSSFLNKDPLKTVISFFDDSDFIQPINSFL